MPLGKNRILGDTKINNPAARPHRVGMTNWPAAITDPRTDSIDALMHHMATSGYEGFEFRIDYFERFFPGLSPNAVANHINHAAQKHGLKAYGCNFHVHDDDMRNRHWPQRQIAQIDEALMLDGEYASFQVHLAPHYEQTAGLYRDDTAYLQWCAARLNELRQLVWERGLNFYIEVHIGCITEDPAALCRILEMCACEITGDYSHYLFRGFLRGKYIDNIRKHTGHTHIRLARLYGDLSAAVDDLPRDWANRGLTWQIFQYMLPALQHGLSSRCILGETGPMHLVTKTLDQDAKLIPLYRAMARYADASAQGIDLKVESPDDLKPWG